VLPDLNLTAGYSLQGVGGNLYARSGLGGEPELVAPGGYLEKVFSRGVNPGIAPPAVLDLKVVSLTFGLTLKINLASLLGIVLALVIYRKL